MDWEPVLYLIDAALKAKGISSDAASRDSGHPDAIRNMRRKAEGKLKGGVTFDTVMDVALHLGIRPEAICRAAMGLPAETSETEAIRKEILAEFMAKLTPAPKPESKSKKIAGKR
jgi:hypothetical protein